MIEGFFDVYQDIIVPKSNITDLIPEPMLEKIGSQAIEDYKHDWDSMQDWRDTVEQGMELVDMTANPSNYPWDGAANFRTPVIAQACLKFSDRASSELLRTGELVKFNKVGAMSEDKMARCRRVKDYMNWQLNFGMEEWRGDQDRLLYTLPLVGTVFKKVMYDPVEGRPMSRLICYPDFAVSQSTEPGKLMRFSECLWFTENEVYERMAAGVWRRTDLSMDEKDNYYGGTGMDEEKPYGPNDNYAKFIEQHTYYDLDEDGYAEPYICIIHEASSEVVRVTPRFEAINVELMIKETKENISLEDALVNGVSSSAYEVVRIVPEQCIVKYGFLQDPKGSYLDLGFSHLLLSLAGAINKSTNDLLNSATLSTLGATTGFLSSNFRTIKGEKHIELGKFIPTDIESHDLQNSVLPLPVREPSSTLYTLVEKLMVEAEKLSSSEGIEKAVGQNTPATTALALTQEQQEGITALIRKIYRAMSREFKKLYTLNGLYGSQVEYQTVLDNEQADILFDFNQEDLDLMPVANPEVSSKVQRIQLAQAEMTQLQAVMAVGGDTRAIVRRYYQAIGSDNINEILPEQTPEQELQELMTRSPELAELITNEQQRQAMLTQAQQQSIERQALMAEMDTQSKMQKRDAETQRIQLQTQIEQNRVPLDDARTIADIEHKETLTEAEAMRLLATMSREEIDKIRQLAEIDKIREETDKIEAQTIGIYNSGQRQ